MIWEDIHGWFTPGDSELYQMFAREVPDGETIVELGSLAGRSTVCLLEYLRIFGKTNVEVVAIDLWPNASDLPGDLGEKAMGDPIIQRNQGCLLRSFLENIPNVFRNQVRVLQCDAGLSAKMFERVWGIGLKD
jgi:hypothetical protein